MLSCGILKMDWYGNRNNRIGTGNDYKHIKYTD